MTGTTIEAINLNDPSAIEAALAALRNARKRLKDADQERQGAVLLPAVAMVASEQACKTSAKSGFTGTAIYGIPVTVDGVLYHVRLQLTHVQASADAKKALKDGGSLPADWPFEITATKDAEGEGDTETPEADAPADEETKVDLKKAPAGK